MNATATSSDRHGNGNGSITHQLEALERAIEDAARDGGADAIALAEKGRHILGLARTLADDIAHASSAQIAGRAGAALHRAREFVQHEAEAARETVRAHPLAAVGGVAAVSALTAALVTLMLQRERRTHW